MFENFWKILKTNIWKILGRIILKKFVAVFSLDFGNNLKKKGYENFEEIYVNPKIMKKF